MTNVPDKVREAWKDIYILFDTHFKMDCSEQAWIKYWNQANGIVKKYGDEIPVLEILIAVANMIDMMHGNHSLEWQKDEPYPYPKEVKKQ